MANNIKVVYTFEDNSQETITLFEGVGCFHIKTLNGATYYSASYHCKPNDWAEYAHLYQGELKRISDLGKKVKKITVNYFEKEDGTFELTNEFEFTKSLPIYYDFSNTTVSDNTCVLFIEDIYVVAIQ